MSSTLEVRVPDIGDFKDVPVIEVLVKPGDRVKKNDSIVTLESDKASMEVPSSADGVVQTVNVKVGDKIWSRNRRFSFSTASMPANSKTVLPTPVK